MTTDPTLIEKHDASILLTMSAGPLLADFQLLVQRGPVLAVAVEDFVGLGEALPIQDQGRAEVTHAWDR